MAELLASDMTREDEQQTISPPLCATLTHLDKEMAIKQHWSRFQSAMLDPESNKS